MCPMKICRTPLVINGIHKHVTVWQMLKSPLSCVGRFCAKVAEGIATNWGSDIILCFEVCSTEPHLKCVADGSCQCSYPGMDC